MPISKFARTGIGAAGGIQHNPAASSWSYGVRVMSGIRRNEGRTWRRRAPWRLTTEETGGALRREGGEGDRPTGLFARLAGAVHRRAKYAWRLLREGDRSPAVPAAMIWLAAHGRQGALSPSQRDPLPCPGLTAAALSTVMIYGQLELAREWSQWLLTVQLPTGAFPDAGLQHASLFNTAQAIQGLAPLADELPAAHAAIERACQYLASSIDGQGRLAPADGAGGAIERWAAPSYLLSCLPPLAAAARRCEQAAWQEAVERAVQYARRCVDLTHWSSPLPQFAASAEALLQLGCRDLAREALAWPAALQRRDGSVPFTPAARWASSAGMAHLAVVWYKLGEAERADRIMASLRRRQRAGGGFAAHWGRCFNERREAESAWAVKFFLDAAQLQVQAAFSAERNKLPAEIAVHDGRLAAACAWLSRLGSQAAVADVGCGPGRYLRQLAPRFPAAKFTGIDVSRHCLDQLPACVEGRRGGMLRLPAADGEFDGAVAVESLEHSLLPERAVRELCRIVRPGGRVLIIDKNLSKQPLSEHEPWEQWFSPGEVAAWLSPFCHEVSVMEIPHGQARQPTGLFLCWQGRRRE